MNDNLNYITQWGGIPILLYMIVTLIGWTLVVSLIPRSYEKTYIPIIALCASSVFFAQCIQLLFYFNCDTTEFQFFFDIPLIPEYNINITCGLDGISMCFLLLTAFIIPLCLLLGEGTIYVNYKEFVVNVLLVEIFLVLSFCSLNLLFFFVFFESVLIPMFFIIGIWGGRERKINANYYFFLYTLFGSFFLLFGILCLFKLVESFDYRVLLGCVFYPEDQRVFFFLFFIPFAIKIPMMIFHLWLPEAHVEAPTIGSVILASLLLKLGGYGCLRFVLPLFPEACMNMQPIILLIAVIGVLYGSGCALIQSDLKRIIAYSSIAHMNLAVIGLFSFTHQGLDGAMYLMMGHGVVSAALFICVGDLYDRYHTRLIKYFSGLVQVMPLLSMVFFAFSLGNMSFPGTSNFVGEFLILTGSFEANTWMTVLGATGIILSAIYAIWLFNRLFFGTLKNEHEDIAEYSDLNIIDFFIFIFLICIMFSLGIQTECITNLTAWPIAEIVSRYYW